MYAIIKTGGKQYKVQPGDIIDIERLDVNDDNTVEFDEVLAFADDNGLQLGTPKLDGATVSAELLEQRRGPKLIVFKMKRRKGNRVRKGHRQDLSRVKIVEINPGK